MAAFSSHCDTHMYVRGTKRSLYKPDQNKCRARNVHEGTEQRRKAKQHKHTLKRMKRSQTKQRKIWKPNQILQGKIPITVCHTPPTPRDFIQSLSVAPGAATHSHLKCLAFWCHEYSIPQDMRGKCSEHTHTFLSTRIWFYFHFTVARQNSSAGQCFFG